MTSRHHRFDHFDMQRIGDGGGHAGAIAMVRNALLMPSRFGSPKLIFDAPQDVLTLSSSAGGAPGA